MAYDERLAQRVRVSLGRRSSLSPRIMEKKMFGGLSFLLDGKMCCGVIGAKLVLRLGETQTEAALTRSHTEPMTFTGRAMKSMVYVLPAGTKRGASLDAWLAKAVEFTDSVVAPARKASHKK